MLIINKEIRSNPTAIPKDKNVLTRSSRFYLFHMEQILHAIRKLLFLFMFFLRKYRES